MGSIALIDYGIGNVQSVANALHRAGGEPMVVRDGDGLRAAAATCIVMPGVGAVGEALQLLRDRGLDAALNDEVRDSGVPFLGICVGMQVMAEVCEEFGEHAGLGWIAGRVRRLAPENSGLPVPHVGWNTIAVDDRPSFLKGLDGRHFYFVHSYALDCPEAFVLATADYGVPFVAAVQRGRISGVQFHPEKSSGVGETLLRNFLASAMRPAEAGLSC